MLRNVVYLIVFSFFLPNAIFAQFREDKSTGVSETKSVRYENLFQEGSITFQDSTLLAGEVLYNTKQPEKVHLKLQNTASIQTFLPKEIKGFKVLHEVYEVLDKVKLYVGLVTVEKSKIFGKLLSTGKIKMYLVIHKGSDGIIEHQFHENFVLIKDTGEKLVVPFQIGRMIGKKKIGEFKQMLSKFCQEVPEVVAEIQKMDSLFEFWIFA